MSHLAYFLVDDAIADSSSMAYDTSGGSDAITGAEVELEILKRAVRKRTLSEDLDSGRSAGQNRSRCFGVLAGPPV